MTKRTLIVLFSLTLFLLGPAIAMAANDGTKRWHVNLIGHPKDADAIGGDDSNGHAIMVPLKNVTNGKRAQSEVSICESDPLDQTFVVDDEETLAVYDVPDKARIYFKSGYHFEIEDRDATDSDGATIIIPANSGVLNISMRVLGKPTTCMDIDGYAYDQNQGLYFWSGRVDLNRKRGKSPYASINDLLTVHWCEPDYEVLVDDLNADECVADTEEELPVFDPRFAEYFWHVQNHGVRIVQIKIEHSDN